MNKTTKFNNFIMIDSSFFDKVFAYKYEDKKADLHLGYNDISKNIKKKDICHFSPNGMEALSNKSFRYFQKAMFNTIKMIYEIEHDVI